jgi:hypothetical protein
MNLVRVSSSVHKTSELIYFQASAYGLPIRPREPLRLEEGPTNFGQVGLRIRLRPEGDLLPLSQGNEVLLLEYDEPAYRTASVLGISTFRSRIPNDLPQVSVRILKIAVIPAPKCILTRLDDPCPRLPCRLHHFVDLVLAVYQMADAEFGGASRSAIDLRVKSKVITGENRKFHPRFELEESHRTMLELRADDPFCGQT